MADYIPDIKELLPQQAPFVMVDELLYADDSMARTRFRVRGGNPLVDRGRFTEGGLLENIAQTVAAGAGFVALRGGRAVVPGLIVAVTRFTIAALPALDDELFTDTEVRTRIPDIIVISGKITCRETVIATCEMKILTSV
jgi:predicted hotdog family 3-hydroxylacyl-ACP dehydratase